MSKISKIELNIIIEMLSKILVVIDSSEPSRRAFINMPHFQLKDVMMLLVVNIFDTFERVSHINKELKGIAKQIEKQGGIAVGIGVLRTYESEAKDSGIKDVKTIRREGNAAREILRIADGERIDTIVIGSRGLSSAAREFLLGGVCIS
jgi:nucleotide-binding universal stress UspA family protein